MNSEVADDLAAWLEESLPAEASVLSAAQRRDLARLGALGLLEGGEIDLVNEQGGTDDRVLREIRGKGVRLYRLRSRFAVGSLANVLAAALATFSGGPLAVVSGASWSLSALLLFQGIETRALDPLQGEVCKRLDPCGGFTSLDALAHALVGQGTRDDVLRAVGQLQAWSVVDVVSSDVRLVERLVPAAALPAKKSE